MRRTLVLFLALALLPAAAAEGKDGPSPTAVHKAVGAGADWLRKEFKGGYETERFTSTTELVVLTLTHAGVSPKDEVLADGLKTIETCALEYTYRVATLAMALERINPHKYRARLAHCAQWLVDTQLPGGEWGYPGSVQGRQAATRAIKVDPPEVPKTEGPPSKQKPLIIVRKVDASTYAGQQGDFSNTQFALLGLRACQEARIQIPKETWQAALAYMKKYQHENGSWGYVVSGEQDEMGFASLTAAGLVGVAICLKGMGKSSPRSDPVVKKGLSWLAKRWDASQNVGIDESSVIAPRSWQYYHLYSIERAGRVLNVKKFGGQAWYPLGAHWLLAHQKADGSWEDPDGDTTGRRKYLQVADTCFAILFLTLSTPPLTGKGWR